MRLTQYTDYSLRVLIYLGLRGDRPSTIREIARSYGISRNHLMKVVHRLGRFGYIDTLRGRGGGIRLSKAAPDIRIGEVVRKTEENWTLVECFDLTSNTCRIDPVCTLKHAIGKALSSFYSVLDRYTLEDVLQHRKALSTILHVERLAKNQGRRTTTSHSSTSKEVS